MLTVFANPVVKYLTAALAAVLIFGGAYVKGRWDGTSLTESKYANAKAEWQKEVAVRQSQFNSQLSEMRLKYEREASQYRREISNLKTNPQIVTQYIPTTTQCNIPSGFVELHNKAADGKPLGTPSSSIADQSGKSLGEVGSVVAQNYYQCNLLKERLIILQDIVKEYQKKQKELTK